ncbi:RiPP maturation radical SAM C-methyltransferase (plasmid) [Sphingobium sp. SJ10-10]|uniref:RiPP maturation radical SAM C-methyltransferase n=1 Tax=Sphingobium sp. SJ10-10 TaxID=3114999 RepID=UPI002E19CB86|nr:RiPP maturation radical SAM C-methyltransferase [Sphingobium sp. SJ10-10]
MALINLPWASFRRPSIQLGLLGAIARQGGHHVTLAHLNLELAARLGKPLYDAIAEHRSTSLGDWLFARAAFPDTAPDGAPFIERYRKILGDVLQRVDGPSLTALLAFREGGAERFLREQIAAQDWQDVQLFGLTSTFQQNTACFAMARLLKQHFPQATIVAGGANFDGEMGEEWVKAAPQIDIIVSGEGDVAFPRLLDAIGCAEPLDKVPNLIFLKDGQPHRTARLPVLRDLDSLPLPDYDEYFERAHRLGLLTSGARLDVDLPVETSRGCWWGERRHCTFCGLNGQSMAFRSKSSDRVRDEFAALTRRYRSYRLFAVDNIADMKFHKSLFPDLAEQGTSYDIFYEVKSGLLPDHLERLKAAGVSRIQPGIESLSTHVLGLMDKGVRAIANVNLLRWSAILGMDVSWNLLWGFPGEHDQDYLDQAKLARNLWHLQPPIGVSRIWLERFSPLFQRRGEDVSPPIPEASLAGVYPNAVDLSRAAYFFEYDLETDVSSESYAALSEVSGEWKEQWSSSRLPRLDFHYSPGFLQIDDLRDPSREGVFTYEGDAAEIYRAMTRIPRTVEQLLADSKAPSDRMDIIIDEFCALGLAMRDGEQLLALALPYRREGRRA